MPTPPVRAAAPPAAVKRWSLRAEWYVLLDTPPVYYAQPAARNWAATVFPDPDAPGGLERAWWSDNQDGMYLIPEGLPFGSVIEFGANLQTSRGKQTDRAYCVVEAMVPELLTLAQYRTPDEAFRAADELRRPKPKPPVTKDERSKARQEEVFLKALHAVADLNRAQTLLLLEDLKERLNLED